MSGRFPQTPTFTGFNEPRRIEGEVFDLEVEGELPATLNGTFYRCGPDARFPPRLGDDININGEPLTTGVVTEESTDGTFIFPNPARDEAILRLDDNWRGDVRVDVLDAIGKQVLDLGVEVRSATGIRIPLTGLSAGMHMVRISSPERRTMVRLMVEGGTGSGIR